MAITAKILSWRFRHLNIVGCLLKRRPTRGGHGHPRTPLATPLVGKDPSQKKEPQGSAYGNHDIPVSGSYHMIS